MEWMAIIFLLVFSLALIVLEIIFIPGTTIFGLAGLILAVIGIFISFKSLGAVMGFSILGGFAALSAVYDKVYYNCAVCHNNVHRFILIYYS